MKTYLCADCTTEFISERAETCLKCGSSCVSSQGEIVQPGGSCEATGAKEAALPAVREVLRKLCAATYDASYQGAEWDQLLDRALEELSPYLRPEKVTA